MAVAQHSIHYHLTTRADLEQLLEDLSYVDAGTIVVAFDEQVDFVPGDLELARIVAGARDFNLRMIIESSDRVLADRALRLGFHDLGVITDRPAPIEPDTDSIKLHHHNATKNQDNDTTANLATYRPKTPTDLLESTKNGQSSPEQEPREESANRNSPEALTAVIETPAVNSGDESTSDQNSTSATAVLHNTRLRSSLGTISVNPPRSGSPPPKNHTQPKARRVPAAAAPARKSSRRKRLVLAAAIVAPILVVGVIALLAVYLLPSATVVITPEEDAVSSSLTYGIPTGAQELDIRFDPSPHVNRISAESSTAATGERFEPDGTAAGSIQITNPFTSEVTVPSGTELTGQNGVVYFTAHDVVIPAADPFGSMSFGSASVGVYAGIAGPNGNLDASSLTGQFASGLFYTNPGAISGGTMRRIAVIAEDDVETVRLDVERTLLDDAERAFAQSIPDGYRLVPDSISIDAPQVEVEGEAGQDGETVSANGSITVRGQIFDPSEFHEMAREEAGRLLASRGGGERILLANSVSIDEPTPMNDDLTAYIIQAEATVRTVITVEEQEDLVRQLVGLSRSEAEATIESHPKISRYTLSIEPDWLPDRMPEILSRIELQVRASEQSTASR